MSLMQLPAPNSSAKVIVSIRYALHISHFQASSVNIEYNLYIVVIFFEIQVLL